MGTHKVKERTDDLPPVRLRGMIYFGKQCPHCQSFDLREECEYEEVGLELVIKRIRRCHACGCVLEV